MMPRIGDQAPDFKVITTTGELTLSEYNKGSWVILFSHPADFTPVCTTEMTGFALEKDFFAAHNTKLLGLSIDSIHSHIAWVNAVDEKTGVLFNFPIIADLDMKVAKLYGMLQPGESETAAVRAAAGQQILPLRPVAQVQLSEMAGRSGSRGRSRHI